MTCHTSRSHRIRTKPIRKFIIIKALTCLFFVTEHWHALPGWIHVSLNATAISSQPQPTVFTTRSDSVRPLWFLRQRIMLPRNELGWIQGAVSGWLWGAQKAPERRISLSELSNPDDVCRTACQHVQRYVHRIEKDSQPQLRGRVKFAK